MTSSGKQLNVSSLTHTPRGQTTHILHDWLRLVRSFHCSSTVTCDRDSNCKQALQSFAYRRERTVPSVTKDLTVVHGVDARLIDSLDGISTLSSSATKKSQEAPVLQIESASLERLRCDPSINWGSASRQHCLAAQVATQVANMIPPMSENCRY